MDTRAVLNLARRARIDSIPELDGVRELAPSITAEGRIGRKSPAISLIVPAFFNRKLKGKAFSEIVKGLEASASIAEVIVVQTDQDASEREDLEQAECVRSVRVVAAPANNRARARNVGAAAASGELLLFLDDDMLVRSWRLVEVIASKMLAGGYDCALFPPRIYARFPVLYEDSCLRDALGAWRRGEGHEKIMDPRQEETVDLPMLFCFPGCFMLIRAEAYRRMGGFDEQYVGWGFEDTDFAVRAIRSLRVLNLFRSCEALLHIDHPVSPYKQEEHRSNSSVFFGAPGTVDVHRLCRSVFPGKNFVPGEGRLIESGMHLAAFAEMKRKGVPLEIEEIRPWLLGVAKELLERFTSPVPEFVVLHGSRATGRARPDSDYDLLCLYAAPVQEFFVTRSEPPVEIECTSPLVFMALAEMPWLYDVRGVFELTKIAQAKLLHGSAAKWEKWKREVLRDAVANGRAFWLVLGLGLLLKREKQGAAVDRYFGSLRHLFELSGAAEDLEALLVPALGRFGEHVRRMLDGEKPKWREVLARREKVFPLQVPEVCSALLWLEKQGITRKVRSVSYASARA